MPTSTAPAVVAWPAVPPLPTRLRPVPPPAPKQPDSLARFAQQAVGAPVLAALVARDEVVTRVMGLLSTYARRDEADRELHACHKALEEDLEIIERCCEMEVRHSLENRVRQTRSHLDEVHGRRGSALSHEPRRRLQRALRAHGG